MILPKFLKVFFLLHLLCINQKVFSQTKILEACVAPQTSHSQANQPQNLLVGAERMNAWLPLVRGKQLGVVVNHSSLLGNTHLVDTLCRLGECIARIYAPEHGFRGKAPDGELIQDGMDKASGAPVISLYGKKKKPLPEDFDGVDVVVFDIQDVGTRFYTYISTLFYLLEACAEQGKPIIVLDRPNPNGHCVDGPVLDMQYTSFVGIAPLPISHGCTVGELAKLFVGEYWIHQPRPLDLQVVPCENYTHKTPYNLPVPPSPNLPNTHAVLLYPSLCLFEGTSASVGRGTDWPFQVVGHPDFASDSFWFVPRPNEGSRYPPQEGWVCKGFDLRDVPIDSLRSQTRLNLNYLLDFYHYFPNKPMFFLPSGYFELLAGTSSLRKQIEAGKTEAEIRATWQADLDAFREIRKKYLLYPD